MAESLYAKKMLEWYDNFYCKSEQTNLQVKFLAKLFKKYKARKILDVSCGTGRHAIALASQNFHVTGIDKKKAMIDYAKNKAIKHGKKIRFIVQDMKNMNLKEKFDAAFTMYGSLAYMKSNEDAIKALKSIASNLKQNGLLVIEDDNPWRYIMSGQLKRKTVEKIKN